MLQTYLFTDIEGSTRLWEQHPQAMRVALAQHDHLLHTTITAHQGHIAKSTGDGLLAAFASPAAAIRAALDGQQALSAEAWPEISHPLRVRMGLHTGDADFRNGDYYGPAVNRAARLMALASGGQTLISAVTAGLVREELTAEIFLQDLGEHRLKDLMLPERIFQVTHPDLPVDFPPLKTPTLHPTNLPAASTRFIGREKELAQLHPLLTPVMTGTRDENPRLVTLTGPGGIGKTRLGLRASSTQIESYLGGVWWVELAPSNDPNLIPQTVLTAIGLPLGGGAAPLPALIEYFKSRTALLILDNCEHLVEACAHLAATLLSACPHLHILTTSRELLGLPGEVAFPVPPLNLTRLYEHSEAVSLFVERATNALPGFALTEANTGFVVEICRRLDGLPLAIELAAARVKVLTVSQIAQRLDDRFKLLTGGSRTALPRQQTLRALVDWSWDLLNLAERALLGRLAVFAGGWTLEAAEAVCAGEALHADDVLDRLYSLVNKSLVGVERAPGQAARYQMLETIRHYALGKLTETGEIETIRARHQHWFLTLAERAEPELRTHAQLEWLNRLDAEHDNLRAALGYSLAGAAAGAEAALRFAGALGYFWHIRGYAVEGRRWTEAALERAASIAAARTLGRAKALLTQGMLALALGDHAATQHSTDEALEIFRERRDHWGTGQALYVGATVPFNRGDYPETQKMYAAAIAAFMLQEDDWGLGNCLHCMAHLAQEQGDYVKARTLFEKSITQLRDVGDRWEMNHPLTDLAWETWLQGDGERAKALIAEHMAGFQELGDKSGITVPLERLLQIAITQGHYPQARALRAELWAIAEQNGHPLQAAWRAADLGQLAYFQNDLTAAQHHFEASRALYQTLAPHEADLWLLSELGWLAYWQGDYTRAETLARQSLDLLEKMGNAIDLPARWLLLGDILRQQGDRAQAQTLYGRYLASMQLRGSLVGAASGLEGLAKLAGMHGQPARAARLFGAADALRKRLGTPLHPVEQAEYDQHMAVVRSGLGGEAFSASMAAGSAMALEATMTFAHEDALG